MKTELGEYYYLVECENCTYEQYMKLADDSELEMRFLGCFEVK